MTRRGDDMFVPSTEELFDGKESPAKKAARRSKPNEDPTSAEMKLQTFHRQGESQPATDSPSKTWPERELSDPRSAGRREVVDSLIEIVRAEGPMVCGRAYRIYADAAGIRRIGKVVRGDFHRAMTSAIRSGRLIARREHRDHNPDLRVVHGAQMPKIVPRPLGLRVFDEVPPSEIAARMKDVADANPSLSVGDLIQRVLGFYGVRRKTHNIVDHMRDISKRRDWLLYSTE